MKKFLLPIISAAIITFVALLGSVPAVRASGLTNGVTIASSPKDSLCQGSGGTTNGTSCTDTGPTVNSVIGVIANTLTFVTGAIAVVMIVVGGIRYVTSGGEEKSIKAAKNTILYAIVGLIVAIAAYAIVNFVLQNVK
ncbi:MAG TPA: pilin [Candidatus Saccharimonas sp.]|nr:pilin [Candidatus Saccharimonas sp.]